ncbi:MAG: TIGR02281 family clan AA aspartic protease [Pseudolabrys sp.]|nr:TIGR02281 family clan AA aspartic protease [Pseudolabrys sp.]
MRNTLILAAATFAVAIYAARVADQSVSTPKPKVSTVALATPAHASSNWRNVAIKSDQQGHFHLDARVDGRSLNFVVDTGASAVVLRESDAGRVGIYPRQNDYTAMVSTANGQIRAAPVRLNRVEIGDITVEDVKALVLPDEALGVNLLGVSFLSRLKRYEVTDGRLVLEQ